MDSIVLVFHMVILIPMVYFIWKDGYNKGLKHGRVRRIKE